ncbi:ESX secretion-associated protein EspG [Antrihabitans cavernicola]|uniref:ESX secretion-associated protein EspG n=1 Tax=Antrihabitans cavernicola TaxID=2495913 RepID=A0A5A7SIZ9_9NOCA|nr:ESX secretion-associated protein EspG [Spelaeibacter cavernicola]KAA0024697.1 ESX secretion-associated protein EspG [Spelaeibacter cavernicola]
MIDLGIGPAPSTLEAVTLTLDEMELLMERLQIDELPVVLAAVPRYDNAPDRDAALGAAEGALTERGLIDDGQIVPDLVERLQVLARPHWIIALRYYVDESISRLCVAKGDERTVLALRGPDTYVIDQLDTDPAGPIIAALGPSTPLDFSGLNAPTEPLGLIFDDSSDPERTAERLAEIGIPSRESGVVAAAMLHCFAHTEIVGVAYGDGTRDQAEGNIAVFDTRDGRFIATSSRAADGTKWSALSSGTDARLRQAIHSLVETLPTRENFPTRQ